MTENTTDPPVIVTGEERPHPALRRLARACIALVRWQRGEVDDTRTPAAPLAPGQAQRSRTPPTTTASDVGETGAAHE